MLQIIPGPLSISYEELRPYLDQAEDAVDRFHVDIVDGVFADNLSLSPNDMAQSTASFLFDYHLMVKDPIKWVDRCIAGRADRIFGHIEMMPNQIEFVEKVSNEEIKVGLALDIDTPILSLEPDILQEIDAVLLMSVKAGHGGQEFNPKALEKIKELADIRQKENAAFFICVDGGIRPSNINDVYKKGADEVVVGKRLFEGDLRENIERFQNAASGVQ